MKPRRAGVYAAAISLFTTFFLAGLLACELAFRAIDHYELWSVRISRVAGFEPVTAAARTYAAQVPLAAGMKREWFDLSPPSIRTRPPNPEFMRIAGRYADSGLTFELFHVYNSAFIGQRDCSDPFFKRIPGFAFIYDSPAGSEYPRYRFPLYDVTPQGLVTNQFGWRGVPLLLRKPSNTIRIAFVGASTTVNSHRFPFSYPELAGFWLNLWAQEVFGARVEIINAGREGIISTDIAAVVRDEVLPLEPDLVVYYEGGNQFHPGTVIKPDGDPGPPPRRVLPTPVYLGPVVAFLDAHSALWRRVWEFWHAGLEPLAEPSKPDYEVSWPPDVNEFDPPLGHNNLPVSLTSIIRDLDHIRTVVAMSGGDLAVSSFFWLVYDGMKLDPVRNRFLFYYLNDLYFPYRYRDMERLAAFQNRTLRKFAETRGLPFLDIAGALPRDPDMFDDAVHAKYGGVRLHAWIVAQMLAPLLRKRIVSGQLPRPYQSDLQMHPAFSGSQRTVLFECRPDTGRSTEIAELDPSAGMLVDQPATVALGETIKVRIPVGTRAQQYAANIPIPEFHSWVRYDRDLNGPLGSELRLKGQIRVFGGDARLGLLSSDERHFLFFRRLEETDGFTDINIPFRAEGFASLVVAAGTPAANDVWVELRDVRVVSVPQYVVKGSIPGLKEPPPE
jgi:hypothetical protein